MCAVGQVHRFYFSESLVRKFSKQKLLIFNKNKFFKTVPFEKKNTFLEIIRTDLNFEKQDHEKI